MSIVFTDVFVGLIGKYVPNKIITCNGKDAPWITSKLKTAIRRNARVYRKWVKRGSKEQEHDNVRQVQNKSKQSIKQAIQAYYTRLGISFSIPKPAQKTCERPSKMLLIKRNIQIYRQLLRIIPISNFHLKANIFNKDIGITLPELISKTNSFISYILMSREQIIDINKFNPKKAHGYDQISVVMLPLCASEISIPLQLIFQKCIISGIIPVFWKYENLQPIHKKGNRQLKTNYRAISLLPICGKILEKITFTHF